MIPGSHGRRPIRQTGKKLAKRESQTDLSDQGSPAITGGGSPLSTGVVTLGEFHVRIGKARLNQNFKFAIFSVLPPWGAGGLNISVEN